MVDGSLRVPKVAGQKRIKCQRLRNLIGLKKIQSKFSYAPKSSGKEPHPNRQYLISFEMQVIIIIIIMAGMAVFLRGWLPHRGKAQMACNYFPTRTMF